jgi:hypothetical protein
MASRMGRMMDTARPSSVRAACEGGTVRAVPCCPPVEKCPPCCILELDRRAKPGEVILVPFRIRNASGRQRSYQVGIRPMVDEHQNPAPSQPTLDRTAVTINPHQSALVEMRLDLSHDAYRPGQRFEATIVVREKEINQNICFRLTLDPFDDVPEAVPCDERDLRTHFVSWHYHFYCDEDPRVTLGHGDRPSGRDN